MARTNTNARRVDRFENCGGGAWVERHDDGNLRVACFKCGDRTCEACGRGRAATIAAALAEQMSVEQTRFVTLTAVHTQMPLRDQIARIYQCFSNLRRHVLWKEKVKGGAAFCEVKISANTGKWHVHLHLIVVGSYLPQRELSAAWHVATGDSRIVHVAAVPSVGDVARYVTKYVTKPLDATVYNDPDHLDEAILALRGRRLCMTFGSWRGVELSPQRAAEAGWVAIERLDSVRARAGRGEADAQNVLLILENNRRLDQKSMKGGPDDG